VIGSEIVAKAAPDGYTLLLTTPSHTIHPAFRASLPYDTEKDLQAGLGRGPVPMLLVSHPSQPFTTFQGFIETAKKNPGKAQRRFGRHRYAAAPHDGMIMHKTGMQVTNVPYRGARTGAGRSRRRTGPAQARQLHDLGPAHRRPQTECAGRHQPQTAETTARRSDGRRDHPGFEGYLWMGIMAPAARRRRSFDKVANAARKIVASPDVQGPLRSRRRSRRRSGPEEFRAMIGREIAQWRELAKNTKITVD